MVSVTAASPICDETCCYTKRFEFGSVSFLTFFQDVVRNLGSNVVTPPVYGTRIIKHECIYSCDTTASPEGLFVNLKTFYAVGNDFVRADSVWTSAPLYLNIRTKYKLRSQPSESEQPMKVALNVPGGFNTSETSPLITQTFLALYIPSISSLFPLHTEPLEEQASVKELLEGLSLPQHVSETIERVVMHKSTEESGSSPWEETIAESQHGYTLEQVPNPVKIPRERWRCAECGSTDNLWLHLADGFIGCGRIQYQIPGTGCLDGREGAAVRHYEEDPLKRPLAVKLRTLTPTSADVYSYPEDAMVIDPLLKNHLRHFGINLEETSKTEASLMEMELEYNKSYIGSRICESNTELVPLSGPGRIGLHNYGNTCYMNATLQLLACAARFSAFLEPEPLLREWSSKGRAPQGAANELCYQLGKVLWGLRSDRYPKQRTCLLEDLLKTDPKLHDVYLNPLLRGAIAKRIPEFGSSRQQDAEEFLRHLFDQLSTSLRDAVGLKFALSEDCNAEALFHFQVEEKFRVGDALGQVRLSHLDDCILSLPLPKESSPLCTKHPEEGGRKRHRSEEEVNKAPSNDNPESDVNGAATTQVSFDMCFNMWMQGEEVEVRVPDKEGRSWKCVTGYKSRKIKTFPPYLVVQLRRFYYGSDWSAKKVDSLIKMPPSLDLTPYRGVGLTEDETLWEDEKPSTVGTTEECEPSTGVQPSVTSTDTQIVEEIEAMGFTRNAALRAIEACGGSGVTEHCVEWIITHVDDPTLNLPLEMPASARAGPDSQSPGTSSYQVPLTSELLDSMGFSPLQIKAALLSCDGDQERALEWIIGSGSGFDDNQLEAIVTKHLKGDTTKGVDLQNVNVRDSLCGENKPEHGVFEKTNMGAHQFVIKALLDDNVIFALWGCWLGRYGLVGFVSHMGPHAGCGHYVCHVKEGNSSTSENGCEGRWVIFNDEKVAQSQNPPFDMGYLYLYKREDL